MGDKTGWRTEVSRTCPMSGITAGEPGGQGSVTVVGWSGEGADWSLQVSLPLFGGHQWAGQEMRRRVTAERKGPPNRKAESAPGFMAPVWARGGGPKAAGAPGAIC